MSNKRILYEETVENWWSNEHVSESLYVQQATQVNTFATAYYIAFGFINSTIGVNTLNTSSCNEYLNVYYDNLTESIPKEFRDKDTVELILITTGMLRNVYITTDACLWTADEMVDDYKRYSNTFSNTT